MSSRNFIPQSLDPQYRLGPALTALSELGFDLAHVYENRADVGSLLRADNELIDEIWYRDVELPSSTCRISSIDTCLEKGGTTILRGEHSLIGFEPTEWKEHIRIGPILLVPLTYRQSSRKLKRQAAAGLLVLFSTSSSQRKPGDVRRIKPICDELVLALQSNRCAQQLRWEQRAIEVLADTTTRLLQFDMTYRTSTNLERGNPRDAVQLVASQRSSLAQEIVSILGMSFTLSRCAILLPSKDYPESWAFAARFGFPSNQAYDKRLYRRGEGLTGETLLCSPGELVCCSDIESDKRWSRKFGDKVKRNHIDKGPLAFLGVPIFSRTESSTALPYGVLVCIRSRNANPNAGAFTSTEKLFLQTLSVHIAYAYDTLQWREQAIVSRERQLKLSRIWASRRNERQMFKSALRLLQLELPFRRLLLSVVDPDRKQIVGRAVVGFDEDLVTDTVRPILLFPPTRVDEEDILGRVCRERKREPFVVNPKASPEQDEYAINVNVHTKVKHRVTNHLLLIPMTRYAGDVVGIVLAEFSDQMAVNLSAEDLQRFSIYANQLASLVELHHSESDARRERNILLALTTSFSCHMDKGWSSENTMRSLLSAVCREYSFTQGLIYKYNEANHLLTGAIGHAVNGAAVRDTVYSLEPDDFLGSQKMSLARAVYLQRTPVYLTNMGEDTVVDQEDRDRVGISKASAALGIPLCYNDTVFGVMILCPPNACAFTDKCLTQLMTYGAVAALAIAIEDVGSELENNRRAAASQEVIIRQIGMIAEHVSGDIPVNVREIAMTDKDLLQVIATDAAQLFDAPLCGLFLADEASVLPLTNSVGNLGPRPFVGNRAFRLRAGIGYECDIHDPGLDETLSYRAQEKGLTAQVLMTLGPVRATNVVGDERWSKRLENYITPALRGKNRAWMGVPIAIRDSRQHCVFGVLTFTRERRYGHDTTEFSDRDVSVAENIAWLIALALYNKQRISRVTYALRQILGVFMHEDIPRPLVDVRDTYARRIRLTMEDGVRVTADVRKMISENCNRIEQSMRFVLCGFSAYQEYVAEKLIWNDVGRSVDVGEIVGPVIEISRVRAQEDVTVRDANIVPNGLKCRLDKGKVMFIVLSLIQNAIKACDKVSGRRGEVTTDIEYVQGQLIVRVSDNGCGMCPDEMESIFEEGVSSFGSTGLGLPIVLAFARCATDGVRPGKISVNSEPGAGTTFVVSLPIRQDDTKS